MTDRVQFRELVDPETAHEAIRSLDLAPESETVSLAAADGRVLAERIDAPIDVPGFDRAAVDGYAVRARDTFDATETDPATLALVGTVHAGDAPDVTVEPGTCAEISTGAVVPPGADSVVMVEETDAWDASNADNGGDSEASESSGTESESGGPDRIAVRTRLAPGDGVGFAGGDVAAGERALGPGTLLGPREIGTLAALGYDEVPVRGRPTVGIVSTGEELVRPGGEIDHGRGEIHDVNSHAVAAAVREAGGDPRLYPHAGDDPAALESALIEASEECDLVCSSGSTSAGALDTLYDVIEDRGELLLHGVAIKPGKPMLAGRIGGAGYVGLPGYPVSALTIFRVFVAPAVRRAAGLPERETATLSARLARAETYEPGRKRLLPVGVVTDGDGERLAYPVDKGSGATTSLANADGIVEFPADVTRLGRGETVTVERLSPDARLPTVLAVGEDDPAFARVVDRVDAPRYLTRGSRGGVRWLRDGIADCAVVAGPHEPDGTVLASWHREWGLLVPAGNPEGVTGLADLVDRDLRLVNRGTESGLRTSLGERVAALADERGVERHTLVEEIDGFDTAVRAHESPARRVVRGVADAGLGLRVTADRLDVDCVSLGTQPVRVVADPDRTGKAGVASLDRALDGIGSVVEGLAGYSVDG
ncbi:MAG: molybdopterin biosynthesis protein [Halobaculum sp.]